MVGLGWREGGGGRAGTEGRGGGRVVGLGWRGGRAGMEGGGRAGMDGGGW